MRHLLLLRAAGLATLSCLTLGLSGCGASAAGVSGSSDAASETSSSQIDGGRKSDGGSGGRDAHVDVSSSASDGGADVVATHEAAAGCSDGVKDGIETDVDCGGSLCDALGDTCALGKTCAVNADCKANDGCDVRTHACTANLCTDGLMDGDETGVDCGGPTCDALGSTCAVGTGCSTDADCTSGGCDPKTMMCGVNQCTDGAKDGEETDVDCGGPVCNAAGDTCALGQSCLVDADCSNGGGCDAKTHACVATQCSDGIKNGMETDIDCGGSVCDALGDTCSIGGACSVTADCATGGGCDVMTQVCDATTCHDGVKDGMETGVDCGGSVCDGAGYTCAAGDSCTINGDCMSGSCCGGTCSLTVCPSPIAFPPGEQSTINTTATSVSGAAMSNSLTLTSGSGFSVGQTLLVQQVQGTNAGQWELAIVTGLAGGNVTLSAPLMNAYSTSGAATAQAVVVPQFTTVDVPATAVVTAPAWNGTSGGVLAFQATGAVTIEGMITMTGQGFRGFSHATTCLPSLACGAMATNGFAGESIAGPSIESTIVAGLGAANGNGGGGGTSGQDCAEGGGGSYGAVGTNGGFGELGKCLATPDHGGGVGGAVVGVADLSQSLLFGGAGGEGGPDEDGAYPGAGGDGGGSIVILAPASVTVSSTGSVVSNGTLGGNGVVHDTVCGGSGCGMGGGGGGAGGSIRIVTAAASLGANLVTATGQVGGACTCGNYTSGGTGGGGRVQVTSANVSGTTNPTYGP